jgi:hypothetical protein
MVDTNVPSGRFLLRIDPGLHASLRAAAGAAGLSLNDYCARKLASPGGDPLGPATAAVARAVAIHGETLLGVVAYGSWARGEATPTSDLDLLIVLAPDAPLHRRMYDAWDEVPLTWSNLTVEPHLVRLPTPGEPPSGLWGEAALDGIVLYDPALRVSRHLVRARREIAKGDLVRHEAHGQPYWTGRA